VIQGRDTERAITEGKTKDSCESRSQTSQLPEGRGEASGTWGEGLALEKKKSCGRIKGMLFFHF
jgi:hypothetical protein